MLAKPVIKPEGVGDLLVLKQQIARYEAGEVAHIENVLGRELRARSHRMFRQTVDRFEEEKERIEENLRDLQSTERFELENEIERTVRSESAFQAGAELSGGFGPVSVSAYARTSSSRAREEARRNATRYAKEIVERATSKLIDRTQSRRATVTTEEVEENNKHEFDNRESGEHVVGIYRWVDKFCRMKMVNYGRRLFYQFIVPEPGHYFAI